MDMEISCESTGYKDFEVASFETLLEALDQYTSIGQALPKMLVQSPSNSCR